ncbi:MAG: DUF4381 domain-containing protein [Bacterioplanes sp.]|nr:DUF4381 domain-containing protein [Bacterioplanes sp.]
MNTVQHPLALEPLMYPEAISWWPLAWGWWIVALLCLLLFTLCIVWGWRSWQQRAPIRDARQILSHYQQHALQSPQANGQWFIQHCNHVLKQVCVHAYPHAVGLSGGAWLHFLQAHSKQPLFDDHYGQVIAHGGYQPHCRYDIVELYQRVDQWLVQLPLTQETD